jgi:hypothetical protein
MSKFQPEWKLYERLVAKLISEQVSTSYSVTPPCMAASAIV